MSQTVAAIVAPPSLLGRRLGPYLIEGKLAEGAPCQPEDLGCEPIIQ